MIDARPEWLGSAEIPPTAGRHGGDWREFVEKAAWETDRTYAIVMTHDHQLDLDIIAELAKRPARYIGLIGSRSKWERFQRMLTSMDVTLPQIQRVVCPIGVGSWGKAPREIAVSAAAQLLQYHYARES